MSNIIEKPFSWANKIIRAVFKGAPNLITTSDLNRQIEALKKEMYVLQQASSVVISDLDCSISENRNDGSMTLSVTGSYVFCRGVRFDISNSEFSFMEFQISSNTTNELRLYAKKSLITYTDDFSKEISGAKFEDGSTQPAANHYVYNDANMRLVVSSSPDSNFEYDDDSDLGEYICTLLRVVVAPDSESCPEHICVQTLVAPMGKGSIDIAKKYGEFDSHYRVLNKDNCRELTPDANDDWKSIVKKLWNRLYTLEKRIYLEGTVGVGDSRTFMTTITNDIVGECVLQYKFITTGNICFVEGFTFFSKYSGDSTSGVNFSVGTASNELPLSKCRCILQVRATATTIGGLYEDKTLVFYGIPPAGGTVYWGATFMYNNNFWTISPADTIKFINY